MASVYTCSAHAEKLMRHSLKDREEAKKDSEYAAWDQKNEKVLASLEGLLNPSLFIMWTSKETQQRTE